MSVHNVVATGFVTHKVDVTVDPGFRRYAPGETRVHFEGDGVDAWVVWMGEGIYPNERFRVTIERAEM